MSADGLHAGWEAVPGLAAYRGVLRRGDTVAWRCPHNHGRRSKAEECAVAELESRRAAERGENE